MQGREKGPANQELQSGGFGGTCWEEEVLKEQNLSTDSLAASHCAPRVQWSQDRGKQSWTDRPCPDDAVGALDPTVPEAADTHELTLLGP